MCFLLLIFFFSAESFLHLLFNLSLDIRLLFQELIDRSHTLTNSISLVREPAATLLDDVVIDSELSELILMADAFSEDEIDFTGLVRSSHFVLDNFDVDNIS